MEPVLKINVIVCGNEETLRDDLVAGKITTEAGGLALDGMELHDESANIVTAGIRAAEKLACDWIEIDSDCSSIFRDWHGGKYSGGLVYVTCEVAEPILSEDEIFEGFDWNFQGKDPAWLCEAVAEIVLRAMETEAEQIAEKIDKEAVEWAKKEADGEL